MADDADGRDEAPSDVALLHGPTDDGEGVRILRLRGTSLEVGEVRAAPEGKPIHGELVRLKPRAEDPRVCDVEVLVPGPAAALDHKGPARVASHAYRDNWSRIFGPRDDDDAPN